MSNFTKSNLIRIFRNTPQTPWSYSDLDRYQREVAHRARATGEGALLLSEVAPVITLGRRSTAADLVLDSAELEQRGIPIVPVDRGGLATYHGPGQWVLFPVYSLERLTGDPRGVKKGVEKLLEMALHVARQWEPRVEARTGCELGLWSPRGKVASVGVHVQEGILLHGLSLNGFRTPLSFKGLRPCGLDLPVDYLLSSSEGRDGMVPERIEKAFVQLGENLISAAINSFDLSR